jgi:glyoxylase-like metal-dependent hydrolase (beta-lactamase superfamily II)
MKLNHICGQTYVIDGSTQVGVYLFHDDTCLLIDSGPADEAGQIRQIIEEQKVKVRAIINTHYHADHCGGTGNSNCSTRAWFVLPHQVRQ